MSLKTEREYHLLKEDKNPYIIHTGLELLVIEKDFGQKRHSLSEERDCILKSFQKIRELEEWDREYLLESIYHYDFQNLCASFRKRALGTYETIQYSLESSVAEFLAEEKKFKSIGASTSDLNVLKVQRAKVDSLVSSYIQFSNRKENSILEEIASKMKGEKHCFRYPSDEHKLFFYSKNIREREAILRAFQEIQNIYTMGDKNAWKDLKRLIKAPLLSGEQFNLSTLVKRSKRVQFYEGVILCEELEKDMHKTIENRGKNSFPSPVIQEVKKEVPKIAPPPVKREEILKAEALKERPKIVVPIKAPERASHTEVQNRLKVKAPEETGHSHLEKLIVSHIKENPPIRNIFQKKVDEQPVEYPAWYLKAVIDGKTSASTYPEKITAIDQYLPKIRLGSQKEHNDFALFAKQFTESAYSDFQRYIPQETLEKTRCSIEQLLPL
ncbi:MAG TPA: hypothetical protein HA294_00645 [Nanoarchaeota archaeon]|nr:hypothetical protein [Nanoarchaeota archaeon]HIJ05048.1 hypothetical protein [Nanoarchaeota archaeon]